MTLEENKALVCRQLTELLDDLNTADELLAPDFVSHSPPEADMHGIERWKQLAADVQASYPGIRFHIDDVIAEGDKVAVRYSAIGYPGMGLLLARIVNGQIAEEWFLSRIAQ